MPKDSLTDAIFELKERDRRTHRKLPRQVARPNRPKRGRPKAFDSFYLFSLILLGLALILQVVAFILHA